MRSARARSVNAPSWQRDFELAVDFRVEPSRCLAPRGLEFGEPARDALEARPPERPGVGEILQLREMLLAEPQSAPASAIVRQLVLELLGEVADRLVDHGAAVARAGRRVDRVERAQPQDVLA